MANENSVMSVSPDATTDYDALVIFRGDTLRLTGTVVVHESFDQDTLYEITCETILPYNSEKYPAFQNLDVSSAQEDYYTYRDTLQAVNGCDSIVTLQLLVVNCVSPASLIATIESDTICDNELPFDWKDTTFQIGTVSGIYGRAGKKMVGSEVIDTIVYIDLTVFNSYYYEETASTTTDQPYVWVGHPGVTIPTTAGNHTVYDSLTAINGCDSVYALSLTITVDATSVSIICATDVYDTLDFGECEMKVSKTKLGVPTTSITPSGTPFSITNDIPADTVFAEGENIITWVITDGVCGYADTCYQRVFIAFPQCPDAVDCEGNVYHGVRIDCDCWTQRNLESTKYIDCNDIPCIYEYSSLEHPNVTENVDRYGRLYCYEAAIRDSSDNGHGHIQGICPAGWYLPTPEKYESLYLHGIDALRSPLYWIPSGGSNTTGFSALPAGFYNGARSRYEGLLGETYFWSTKGVKSSTTISAFYFFMACDELLETHIYEGMGYSVRCIKEKEK